MLPPKVSGSNKFDLCYYGQINLLRLKSSVASKWARKQIWRYRLFCWRWCIAQHYPFKNMLLTKSILTFRKVNLVHCVHSISSQIISIGSRNVIDKVDAKTLMLIIFIAMSIYLFSKQF